MPSAEMLVLLMVFGRFTSSYVILPRLTLAPEWSSYSKRDHNGPGTYAFGYDIEDGATGNVQYRQEEKYPNGTIVGSYGYLDPEGNVKVVHYASDSDGHRVTIENSNGETEYYPRRSNKEQLSFGQGGRSSILKAAMESMRSFGQFVGDSRTPLKHVTSS